MSIPKKILTLCLVFFLGIGMGYVSEHGLSENSRFESFTENLFQHPHQFVLPVSRDH